MDSEWDERLTVPWTWHAGLLVATALLGAEVAQTLHSGPALLAVPFLAIAGFGELLLWRAGSSRVRIGAGTVQVGNWRLPLARVRSVEPLTGPAAVVALRTPEAGQYRLIRGWVTGAVRLEVDDPDDQPIWLFSTRRPQGFTAALVAARAATVPGDLPAAG